MYYYGPMNGNDWGWGVFSGLLWLVVMAVAVFVVVRLFRSHDGGGQASQATPLDIAKARYAKGEINKEQFEQLKKDLK